MRKTRLPKSRQALIDHIVVLTRRIERLSGHIKAQGGRNFRDGNAKWNFQATIQRRGQALEQLKTIDPEAAQQLILMIEKGERGEC